MGCGGVMDWIHRKVSKSKVHMRKSIRAEAPMKTQEVKQTSTDDNYQSLIEQVLRPNHLVDVDNDARCSTLTRKHEPSKRGTIVEEPILEALCEVSSIEPNHLLYDVMTKGERRSLVQKFNSNRKTAPIFESEKTLKEFMVNATTSELTDSVSRNTIAIGRTSYGHSESNRVSVRPVSISSVCTNNMTGGRMGAPERWESIRAHIEASNSCRTRTKRSVRGTSSEATFKDVIHDIVKHRESQLRLKRHLVETREETIEELISFQMD